MPTNTIYPESPGPGALLTSPSQTEVLRDLLGPAEDDPDWTVTFNQLFDHAVAAYERGIRQPDQIFSQEDKSFLASIGASPQEIYDFIEDWSKEGVPAPEIVREVTGIRRDYFLTVQNGRAVPSPPTIRILPSPGASLGGHRWLPRIIVKARAKLRGELPPNIMYGCGGDRPFLQRFNIGLGEFLRVVWEAGDDQEKIVNYVNQKATRNSQTT